MLRLLKHEVSNSFPQAKRSSSETLLKRSARSYCLSLSHLLNFSPSFFPPSAFRFPTSSPSHLLFSPFRIFSRGIVPPYRTTTGPTSELRSFAPCDPTHYIFILLNNIDKLSLFVGKNRGVYNLKTSGIVMVRPCPLSLFLMNLSGLCVSNLMNFI
jgi:hypothetical protein